MAPVQATPWDHRRSGFIAATVCAAYIVAIFVPGAVVAVVLGTLMAVAGVVFAVRVPLPQWRQSDDRKRVAAWAMAGECAAIAAIATVIRIVVVG
jgi:hypothetical protein